MKNLDRERKKGGDISGGSTGDIAGESARGSFSLSFSISLFSGLFTGIGGEHQGNGLFSRSRRADFILVM
ncbi:unnamed protein product [Cuscuta epithymum]|uniref:Uncharacterized protein n=1 Tax=Cuscuta epithymum TaxID=186058 RepID=A0AAV0C661_9ASTE|nr:unnamed protein product [Cuscuta epithymum]